MLTLTILTALTPFVAVAAAAAASFPRVIMHRGVPVDPSGVRTYTSANGASIRFKQPGKDAGICETTPGVDDYSGYISLDATTNMFFWFFEARTDPANKPLTLWLNGGPGSDSLIGLFQEHGPCSISADLTSKLNPYSWNEVSNMLYLSQPVGVGFSYSTTSEGYTADNGSFVNSTTDPAAGRFSLVDPNKTNTTAAAAIGAWHVLQAFLELSPSFDPDIGNHTFNLATESYGGHYGPAFFDYFYGQNELIKNGTIPGVELEMNSLMIINGIVDELTQAIYYPEFANNNTYDVKGLPDDVYTQAINDMTRAGGCADQIKNCTAADRTTAQGAAICRAATSFCRNNVEGPYYDYAGRGVYDIRHPYNDPTPPDYFINFLNLASTQEALGVNINYTSDSSGSVGRGFQSTGDFVFPDFKPELARIIDNGVKTALVYGDADYICNWFGGQAVSLSLNYSHAAEFAASNYTSFLVNGTEYGETRQHGKFSFTRLYESGHETPYYQPVAMLAAFDRLINGAVISDGGEAATDDYQTVGGSPIATHTETFPALPTA